MEQSPLTLQARPEVFQQKIVQLYQALFKDENDGDKSEGFWREFFLLRPDRASLKRMLDQIPPSEILELEEQTRELFRRAVAALKSPHERAHGNALDTLSIFLSAVLAKKYTNASYDIINILAGLDHVDTVFADFVSSLDSIIRNGKDFEVREKAIEVALVVTAGAYQTTILTYFIQRDLFPAIMKFIQDADCPTRTFDAFILIGLLANYNKFEFQNPYQLRLNDFVNEATIQTIIKSVGSACQMLREEYVDVQDDLPEGWTLASALGMIGLRRIIPGQAPKQAPRPVYDAETAKKMFTELPREDAAILLATYDFAHSNKLFCFNLVTLPAEKGEEQPFASYISLTSYLLHHAYLSPRTTLYSHLNLMVFRLLIEDPVLCKRMCADDSKVPTRLCRQRAPHLPLVKSERTLAASLLDTMVDGITHNLRRKLDVGLYTLCVGILLRIISYMSRSKTRLQYHWSELFRALLSLIRFLTQYAADVKDLPHIETLLDHVVNLVALGLSSGESFLPTPAAYDDLFYKVVEAGETLVKFRDTFGLAARPSNGIDTLVSVSTHYNQMLSEGVGGSGKGSKVKVGNASTLTSLQVAEVIKQGYETLSIRAKEGLDSWERYREADERMVLKKMARAAVGDVKVLVGG